MKMFFILSTLIFSAQIFATEPIPWCGQAQVFYDYTLNDSDCHQYPDNPDSCQITSIKECRDGERKRTYRACVSSKIQCYRLAKEFEAE